MRASATFLLTGSALVAIVASGCASHKARQSTGYQNNQPSTDSSQMAAPDTSRSGSGYGGTGMGGSGYDSTITNDSARSFFDTINDPYHYPGTAIPGTPGQGGSGGIPNTDTTHNIPPPDTVGVPDFNERG